MSDFQTPRQKLDLMAPSVYYLTILLTTGTDLDIALDALKCSDLGGLTLSTIQLEVLR